MAMTPQIVGLDTGKHNNNQDATIKRLVSEGAYKDLSTIVIIPALESVPTKAVSAWWNLYFPPNQKVIKLFAQGMEVGEAYSQTIEMIINHPDLTKFKYIVTIEHDNIPEPDGVIKLIQAIENNPQYSCIGGLYFTKGEGGVPQIWGDPNDPVINFRPIPPRPGELVECCGTGMGFNIFKTEMFKDSRLRRPWFKTCASKEEGCFTQDLYAWTDFRKHGHRCAIDCKILVGHYDQATDQTW